MEERIIQPGPLLPTSGGAVNDPESLSPLVLAYIGDAVYELFVRTALVAKGTNRLPQLHRAAVRLVRATSQADFLARIEGMLTEEERQVMKRGRNARSGQAPRGTAVIAYRLSTGLESLVGYWYLRGEIERLEQVLSLLPWTEDKTEGGEPE